MSYIYICMYVCMYVYVYMYIYIYSYIYICIHTHLQSYTCVYIYIHTYEHYIYIYEYVWILYIYMNICYNYYIYEFYIRYSRDGTQLTGQSYAFPATPPSNRSYAMHKGWNGRNDCSRNSNSKKRQPYNSPWIVETTEGQKSNVLSDASKTCPSLQQGISILKSVEKKRQLMKTWIKHS